MIGHHPFADHKKGNGVLLVRYGGSFRALMPWRGVDATLYPLTVLSCLAALPEGVKLKFRFPAVYILTGPGDLCRNVLEDCEPVTAAGLKRFLASLTRPRAFFVLLLYPMFWLRWSWPMLRPAAIGRNGPPASDTTSGPTGRLSTSSMEEKP